MALKDIEGTLSVLEGAIIRIKNAFSSGLPVVLSMSGGKDSIVLAHIIYTLILKSEIDPKMLTVQFVDEEAIFDDLEKIVIDWRERFLLVGSSFDWYCIQAKHFNCLSTLEDDETFILWDENRKENWVRKMPDFAIKDHHLLKPRKEIYQNFLTRINRGKIQMIGIRTSESSMRRTNIASILSNVSNKSKLNSDNSVFPIYDFTDDDIWLYLKINKIDFPITYLHLYQTGSSRRDMRLSQFFSIDTAKSLVKLGEYDNTLMTRLIKREPNAYLASMYWESEMFRRSPSKKKTNQTHVIEEEINYKQKVLDMYKEPEKFFNTQSKKSVAVLIKRIIIRDGMKLKEKHYKLAYQILISGDPKKRAFRGFLTTLATDYTIENKKGD
jgi:predicted phosphoadenosine phosphosulfate sulfurtransferase